MEMNMSFEKFQDTVKGMILQYMSEDYEEASVEVRLVEKNGGPRHGLTVKKDDNGIAPTIYIEDLYKQYQDGKNIFDVIRQAAELIMEEAAKITENSAGDFMWVTDFCKAKDRIVPNLVSRSEAERMGRPFTPFADDLAVQYSVAVDTSELGQARAIINTSLLDSYIRQGYTLEDVASAAVCNIGYPRMQTMRSFLIERLPEWMQEMVPDEDSEDDPLNDMWVLTNEKLNNGAAVMLDKNVMQIAQERVGEFYILPSSIHEVILISKTFNGGKFDPECLRQMVMAVNDSKVDPVEKLSDNVYQFEEGEVRLVVSTTHN